MDLKSFAIGIACGGLVYAGLSAVVSERGPGVQPEGDDTVVGRDMDSPPGREARANGDWGNRISSESSSFPSARPHGPTNSESSQQPANGAPDADQTTASSIISLTLCGKEGPLGRNHHCSSVPDPDHLAALDD